jgi:AraC-like DNA-binding protein
MSEGVHSTVQRFSDHELRGLCAAAEKLTERPNDWALPMPKLAVGTLAIGSDGLQRVGPAVVLACRGRVVVNVGGDSIRLEPGEAIAGCLPLAVEVIAEPDSSEPPVVLAIELDLTIVAEMLLAIKEPRKTIPDARREMAKPFRNVRMVEAASRLLGMASEPHGMEILGLAVLREVHYHVLTGEHGDAICSSLGRSGRIAKIGRVLRRIHFDPSVTLSAETLAKEACMCLTAFHENFRLVTGTTPLQYIKGVRLQAARVLMVRDGISAAEACGRVGYESPSQFGREFKRHFGMSPGRLMRSSAPATPAQQMVAARVSRHRVQVPIAARRSPQRPRRDAIGRPGHRADTEDRSSSLPISGRRDP